MRMLLQKWFYSSVVQRKWYRLCFSCHGLKYHRRYSIQHEIKHKNELLKYLRLKIEATGPITVAEYMKEVLTNPLSGYYMHQDVFGSFGDFVTSPEISQMFGELIAIWFLTEWSKVGQPKPLQLVELGPGRGTLIDDILKVFSKLSLGKDCLSLHLVEISPFFSQFQKNKLCPQDHDAVASSDLSTSLSQTNSQDFFEKQFTTSYGYPVMWHHHLKSVPNGFTLFLAHEFFDALPIHKFQKTADGWREILIDYKGGSEDGHLHFVISRYPTPASEIFINANEERNEVEISPESGVIMEQLTTRMKEDGGISLIVDYGHDGVKSDTFRSFKKHKQHDPLSEPGTADLTADVDFSYLKRCTENKAVVFGPIDQADFLRNMGIDVRLQRLLQNASPEEQELLKLGYDMLTNSEKMGQRFKFFALFPLVLKDILEKYPPTGFI